jgi:hypothetical protein
MKGKTFMKMIPSTVIQVKVNMQKRRTITITVNLITRMMMVRKLNIKTLKRKKKTTKLLMNHLKIIYNLTKASLMMIVFFTVDIQNIHIKTLNLIRIIDFIFYILMLTRLLMEKK